MAVTALRRPRVAITVLFAVNGLAFAAVVPMYPQLQAAGQVSAAGWGIALAGYPIGTLAAAPLVGRLVRRCGSAAALCAGITMLGAVNAGFAVTGSLAGLLAVFLVLGCLDAVIEVAANVQALTVQTRYSRWLLHTCHAAWSAGAITGGLLGAFAAAAGLWLGIYLPAVAVGVAAVVAACRPWLLPDDPAPDRAPAAAGRRRWRVGGLRGRGWVALAAAGAVAGCGAYLEDVPASWGAIYLTDLGAGAGMAGLAVVAAQASMTGARAAGDWLCDRYGPRRVVRAGAAVTVAGMSAALVWPAPVTVLTAFGLCGLGAATAIPAAVDRAAGLPGYDTASAVTAVSMIQRAGPLLSPLLIGTIAGHGGLRSGLLTVPVVAAALWLSAGVLTGPARRS
jgi:MFS family permease